MTARDDVRSQGATGPVTGTGVFHFARCSEHGLHGQRSACFVCDGPVEQVPFVPVDDMAVERVAAYLRTVEFTALPDCGGDRRAIAEACLRAAGESS